MKRATRRARQPCRDCLHCKSRGTGGNANVIPAKRLHTCVAPGDKCTGSCNACACEQRGPRPRARAQCSSARAHTNARIVSHILIRVDGVVEKCPCGECDVERYNDSGVHAGHSDGRSSGESRGESSRGVRLALARSIRSLVAAYPNMAPQFIVAPSINCGQSVTLFASG